MAERYKVTVIFEHIKAESPEDAEKQVNWVLDNGGPPVDWDVYVVPDDEPMGE